MRIVSGRITIFRKPPGGVGKVVVGGKYAITTTV
jgi:hypothetical protein